MRIPSSGMLSADLDLLMLDGRLLSSLLMLQTTTHCTTQCWECRSGTLQDDRPRLLRDVLTALSR